LKAFIGKLFAESEIIAETNLTLAKKASIITDAFADSAIKVPFQSKIKFITDLL
jgi:hypothetical protein